ncbi:hypothetical protein [Roseicella aerolata]|uniref:Uncharacterized protein n=1 Tax=Roseicella aerolata TaxID=2883479 RepID=A0A9X1IHM5_9PROT|nr:hypothetical protein [Roseicella aerolata]MCB4823235.1 hypothetical protein [Roseicella aerolata]
MDDVTQSSLPEFGAHPSKSRAGDDRAAKSSSMVPMAGAPRTSACSKYAHAVFAMYFKDMTQDPIELDAGRIMGAIVSKA